MNRKDFITSSLMATMGFSVFSEAFGGNSSERSGELSGNIATANDLNLFLRSLVDVDEPSVDRIIIGDPATKIRKIGTCWMPYWDTLKQAVSLGINVIVAHEPTFYTHRDLDEKSQDYFSAPEHARKEYLDLVEQKKRWILDNGLVIIRCHDVMDKISDIGIPFALGSVLGFSGKEIKNSTTFYNVYRTNPRKAIDVAREIAAKLKPLNQQGVQFYGDENALVASVGVGTGCACDPMQYSSLEPDLYIAISDSIHTWTQTTFSADSGKPLVVIDHGTSEEMGMRLLSQLLAKRLPEFNTLHFPQGCSYRWVS